MGTETYITNQHDQVSHGNLIEGNIADLISAAEGMIELSIDDIQSFNLIPDYKGAPKSPNPIILKTPSRCLCLDGWSLIQQAKAQGIKNILCFAYYSDECTDEEIAIKKAAVRIVPHAGTGSYVEIIRNVKMLYQMLLNKKNVVEFSHGGIRKGEGFINNKDENVRHILAQRLGKSISSISKYLNHGEYVNNSALNTLLDAGDQSRLKPDKEFFEMAQSNKRRLKEMLTSRGVRDRGLTEEISKYILGLYQEYRSTGIIASISNDVEEDDGSQETFNSICSTHSTNVIAKGIPLTSAPSKEFTPPEFKYTSSADMAIEPASVPPTKSDIHAELIPLASRLSSLASNHGIDLNEVTDGIKSLMTDLSFILQKALSIPAERPSETGR